MKGENPAYYEIIMSGLLCTDKGSVGISVQYDTLTVSTDMYSVMRVQWPSVFSTVDHH